MDKKKLNEEIVLCRPIVKKAKVWTIRKLIKRIKLLRSCKKEELREKKLRKGKRLAAEVHMMKSLRPDYVTKFALLTENFVSTGSNTKLKRKRNACAKLVKHKELVQKVNSIRDKFPNWKEELPILLNSSKRKKDKDEEENTENTEVDKVEKPEEVTVNEEITNERLDVALDVEPEAKTEVTKISKPKVKKSKATKAKLKKESSEADNIKKAGKKEEGDYDIQNDNSHIKVAEQKIDDPFFIGKKVTVPLLLQKGNEDHPENESKETKQKLSKDTTDDLKPRHESGENVRKRSNNIKPTKSMTEDELHPSWKAKKIQMIKPFEGKKIKFD